MPKTIIADTSCFILLSKIEKLDILKYLYGNVNVTREIANEYNKKFPDWVKIHSVSETLRQEILEIQVDKGEASAIALAMEIKDSVLILDDYKARKIAETLNLKVTGTIGVIIKAKHTGVINSVKPILESIKETDFRMSTEIVNQALKEAGEF